MRSDSDREAVRARYAELAAAAEDGGTCCTPDELAVFGAGRYDPGQLGAIPEAAAAASIGCGNPTAVADLAQGEVVLDLGSGGGIDVILSARRVGASGKAYGLDMTDEMLDLARRNAAEAGLTNVEFLNGHIEQIPLPDASVDVVISNCVINLSTDKAAVIAEAARVLRPGGRFAVSDVVADTSTMPLALRPISGPDALPAPSPRTSTPSSSRALDSSTSRSSRATASTSAQSPRSFAPANPTPRGGDMTLKRDCPDGPSTGPPSGTP